MRIPLLFVAVVVWASCRGSAGEGGRPDTLTQRQRDSAIGASRLPGAQGVQKALGAADSAAARNARLDSLRD